MTFHLFALHFRGQINFWAQYACSTYISTPLDKMAHHADHAHILFLGFGVLQPRERSLKKNSKFESNLNLTELLRLLSTKFKNNNSLNRNTLLLYLLTYFFFFFNFVDSRRESLVGIKFDSNFEDFWSFFLEAT